MDIALTYLYGVGRKNAQEILAAAKVPFDLRSDDLTEDHVAVIREIIERDYKVEGDLRRDISMNIKRLMDLGATEACATARGCPPVASARRPTRARGRAPRRVASRRSDSAVGRSTASTRSTAHTSPSPSHRRSALHAAR
jgi:small subunit ribosomal protein S13